eukprot:m.15898 g.15898  ORF g.15898 m.15898 type:complete len:273 (-) comp5520_c0_seq1:196-1014(-)
MADAYSAVRRTGSLKLKGQKRLKKKKRKHQDMEDKRNEPLEVRHGGFWLVTSNDHLRGNVLIETTSGGYISAVDDGTLTTAPPRPADNNPENLPEPQEIITIVKTGKNVAFKTAYGRYLSAAVETGEITAQTEAIGPRELWEPVIQDDGIIRFRSADQKYLNGAIPGQIVHAKSESLDEAGVMFRVHTSIDIEESKPKKKDVYDIEGGSLKNMEVNYVQKFQSYQGLRHVEGNKVKVSTEERKNLKQAVKQGKLHEEMLNRRSKLKADRMCK